MTKFNCRFGVNTETGEIIGVRVDRTRRSSQWYTTNPARKNIRSWMVPAEVTMPPDGVHFVDVPAVEKGRNGVKKVYYAALYGTSPTGEFAIEGVLVAQQHHRYYAGGVIIGFSAAFHTHGSNGLVSLESGWRPSIHSACLRVAALGKDLIVDEHGNPPSSLLRIVADGGKVDASIGTRLCGGKISHKGG